MSEIIECDTETNIRRTGKGGIQQINLGKLHDKYDTNSAVNMMLLTTKCTYLLPLTKKNSSVILNIGLISSLGRS